MSDFRGKSIAVVGMARTGMAVARVLHDLGARVVLYDRKDASQLSSAVDEANELGATVRTGTDYVDLNGIDMLVPSPGAAKTLPVFDEALKRGVEVVSEIELAYRIARASIVAITGTNGKTTTTVLTGLMFAAAGRGTYVAGNAAGTGMLQSDFPALKTLEPVPLVTAAHAASPDDVIVAEISTFQLEWISRFRPRVAALLNVTCDHMDRHASFEEYAALKARIFENQTADDFAITNAENPFTASLAPSLRALSLRFARNPELIVNCHPEPVEESQQGAFVRGDELIVRIAGRETVVCRRSDTCLRGEHNIENILAASCAVAALGADLHAAADAIRVFRGVEHRLEHVAFIDGVEYINNSMCTNVDAAVRSVEAIDEPQIVIAGGKDKGSDYALLGAALARKAKHVVLIGADADLILDAARNAGFDRLTKAESMLDAVEKAREIAEPGDVVVLSPGCASFDMFDSFEHRGRLFKEAIMHMQEVAAR